MYRLGSWMRTSLCETLPIQHLLARPTDTGNTLFRNAGSDRVPCRDLGSHANLVKFPSDKDQRSDNDDQTDNISNIFSTHTIHRIFFHACRLRTRYRR